MDVKYNPSLLTSSLTDPQIKLSKALMNRDISEFRDAFKIGANALAKDKQNLSIFEKVLQTPGCWQFVKECLQSGCDPNHLNSFFDKAAISFACDSRDPQNLQELLSSPGITVDRKYSGLTPLNSLAKNLNEENFHNVKECIRILLRYGASPNVPDQREMTPLHNVIKNRKINDAQRYEIVQMFLSLADIDIDTYREGELRKLLETEYPLIELPGPCENNATTFNSLLTAIRSGNTAAFEKQYKHKSRNTNKDEEVCFLVVSIKRGAHQVFNLILASGVDYNRIVNRHNTPIEIAWTYGNWYALEKLLQQPDIKIRTQDCPLVNIVSKLNKTSPQEFCDYWKCFYVLLNSEKIDINATDCTKSTALHYAVRYQNKRAIQELLKRGACIGLQNTFHELPLTSMAPSLWEEHLDDCISSSDDKFGDKAYEIIISFKNFLTSQEKRKEELNEALRPIAFMANSKEHRYLLQHPVVTSILYLKWHKMSLIFYINFLCYMFFSISIITHTVLKFREKDHEILEQISIYCSWLGICYLITRELVQFFVFPIKYLKSFTNYLEIMMIVLCILTIQIDFQIHIQRNIAVACILLLAYDLVLLVGSLPVSSISTHMLMLEAVCISFVKSFFLYSIFILTFTLCFYIISDDEKLENEDEAFHRFGNPLVAFMKTIVMFTGEFDAGSLKLDSSYGYLLFLTFVFFMAIILFNLLNGLAVSDTQAIQDQAELNDIICRTKILYRYERAFFQQTSNLTCILKRQPFRLVCQVLSKLFPDYTTDVQISILPNDNNRILAYQINKKKISLMKKDIERDTCTIDTLSDDASEPDVSTKYEHFGFSYLARKFIRIDERTVTQAMAILEKKSSLSIESRLDGLEEKLNQIIKFLDIQNAQQDRTI